MSTYLKHMGGYTYKQLKGKSFDEIQKLFDKEMKRVNTFVAMGSEVQESKEKKEEGREETTKGSRKKMLGRKRAVKEQQKESSKKLKVEETKDQRNGSSKRYSSMIRMLQGIDREDLEALWRVVKCKVMGIQRPEDNLKEYYSRFKSSLEPDIKNECDEYFLRRNLKISYDNNKFTGEIVGSVKDYKWILRSYCCLRCIMPNSIQVDHRDTAYYIPMYHPTGGFTGHEREVYKSLVTRLFHEGRVILPDFLENEPNLRNTFTAIGFDCLLDIDEQIYPIFVLQFYKSVRLIRNLNGTVSIAFVIDNVEIVLTLENFARILKIPGEGVCVYTSEWPISSLFRGCDPHPNIYPPPHEEPSVIRDALFHERTKPKF
ncbi:hypothetical protein Tco_1041002 [Tanacetum coccineum]|uniref:Uncharacterized protein n=1 Tax=Tanacetum coccineum TaxID=301880 RepID=A0ABQ5GH58_9ASTR